MKIFQVLGLMMILCGAAMLWSVSEASDVVRINLGLVAGFGQIGIGLAWIFFGDRLGGSKS